MDYSAILKRAAGLVWRQRSLWLLGFLAAFLAGAGDDPTQFWRSVLGLGPGTSSARDLSLLGVEPMLAAVLGLGMIGLEMTWTVITMLLAFPIAGGLIQSVDETERLGKASPASGLRAGVARWLPLLGIGVVVNLPLILLLVGVLAVGLAISLFSARPGNLNSPGGLCCFWLPVAAVAFLLSLAASLCSEFMNRKCMLEGLGTMQSLREGFYMLRANRRQVLPFWLLLLVISLVASLVLDGANVLVRLGATTMGGIRWAMWPSLGESVLTGLAVGIWPPARSVLRALAFFLATRVAFSFPQGLVVAFASACWTLFYRELARSTRPADVDSQPLPPG